ncbi:hypothetical protein Pen02_27520 [Plantactinospora endophytica]|uniref:Uncharacterized protein n=1 Tax=Plantactinospora endophytica TaxID=673535 RepID=A0ABQ4DZE6_9ACTN|nr:hypothetical protein Pen02_27520 [Plantactinospora endophytica]
MTLAVDPSEVEVKSASSPRGADGSDAVRRGCRWPGAGRAAAHLTDSLRVIADGGEVPPVATDSEPGETLLITHGERFDPVVADPGATPSPVPGTQVWLTTHMPAAVAPGQAVGR